MDTSRDEMLAMFDSFLGEDFPGDKKESVLSLQQNLHRGQAVLARQLNQQALTDEEYVDSFNNLLSKVLKGCEEVLGEEGFEALFGVRRDQAQGYIDKQTFLDSRAARRRGAAFTKRAVPVHKRLTSIAIPAEMRNRLKVRMVTRYENKEPA